MWAFGGGLAILHLGIFANFDHFLLNIVKFML
jgi:hypothetical protein